MATRVLPHYLMDTVATAVDSWSKASGWVQQEAQVWCIKIFPHLWSKEIRDWYLRRRKGHAGFLFVSLWILPHDQTYSLAIWRVLFSLMLHSIELFSLKHFVHGTLAEVQYAVICRCGFLSVASMLWVTCQNTKALVTDRQTWLLGARMNIWSTEICRMVSLLCQHPSSGWPPMEIFGKCSQAKVWVSLSVLVAVRHCFLAKQTGLRRCGLQSKCIQPTPGQTCGAILGTWLLKPVSCHCLSGCCWAILWYPQPTNTRPKLKHKHVWPSIKLLKFTAQHFKLQ